ncbi:MAG TPA: dienelactone hydrolase family protein [Chroococcidiopsis sp.]
MLHVETVLIPTPDGQMPGIVYSHGSPQRQPAILLLMEAFGLTSHIQEVAARLSREGYVVLTPDLYYRELPNNTFSYDEVEMAMAMMYRLNFGAPMENDLRAALGYLKSRPDVLSERVGVTGFCLGGGLSFLAACRFSDQIAAAAPFYGMVLDEWVAAVKDITVPIYLFHGGMDPFIPLERIQHIESRFKQLDKDYRLKIYRDADHGFFCHERSSYNHLAAADSWQELTQFFGQHLQKNAQNGR